MIDHKQDYDDGKLSTTDGTTPKQFASPAPDPMVTEGGQYNSYWVLSESERSKGFVRPVRDSYKHETCGAITRMGPALSETYAREPSFYGATFCCQCGGHFPVGPNGQFTWKDTNEKVGT